MPRQPLSRLSQQVLDAKPEDRLRELQVEFRLDHTTRQPGRVLGTVGGLWDMQERRFVGRASRSRVIPVMEGQRETVDYWFAWFRAYLTGDWRTFEARRGPRPFSLWTFGGRRRGKSYIGVALAGAFAVAVPSSYPWLISPIEDDFLEGEEIPRYWKRFFPPSWYEWNERDLYVQLVNGTRVLLRSAHDPEKLKSGECSYAFLNEAQKLHGQRGYDNVRGALADSGSLIHVAANPPRLASGYWVDDLVGGLERGDVQGKLFDYDHANPHVEEEALDAMAKEMTERDYLIERKGRRMPRPDVVMYAFEAGARGHERPEPDVGDISRAFLKRKLKREFAALVSADFQLAPHMAAHVKKYFADPDDPQDAISWTVAEVVLEQGDEDELIDELEALLGRMGLTRDDVAFVGDASGEWQQADRKRGKLTGRGSFDMFRARGWKHLFKPDPFSDRNPMILERVAVANARLRNSEGRRRAFVDPRCTFTVEALRKWPMTKQGFPSRRSVYSHVGDSWTYGEYRLWPRRFESRRSTKIEVVNIHARDDRAWP